MTERNTPNAEISLATEGSQFLTFALGAEEYGLEILKVQEIKGFSAITPIPNTPPYVRGVTTSGKRYNSLLKAATSAPAKM